MSLNSTLLNSLSTCAALSLLAAGAVSCYSPPTKPAEPITQDDVQALQPAIAQLQLGLLLQMFRRQQAHWPGDAAQFRQQLEVIRRSPAHQTNDFTQLFIPDMAQFTALQFTPSTNDTLLVEYRLSSNTNQTRTLSISTNAITLLPEATTNSVPSTAPSRP